jgi:MFS family permease
VALAFSPIARVFRHRDFRLLWSGAFFSFIGSWIQTVGQGYLVYELTRSEAKLASISFAASLPVMLIGPFAGALVDTMNRRNLLIACQVMLALTALSLGVLSSFRNPDGTYQYIQYWHILAAALVIGVVGAFEMPTRQSVISRVVPPEDLAAAIPLNALTFNLARLVGPAVGGILLANFGVSTNYLVNGLSYFALIFTVLAIRANLLSSHTERGPVLDLVLEGMRYTFKDKTLRTLFLLEGAMSVFAIFYIPLIPAIALDTLRMNKAEMAWCYTAMGVGSVFALLTITLGAKKRSLLLKSDMTVMALALFGLAYVQDKLLAYALFAVLGFCAVAHFNTTNTLFQTLSPERLRGRVLSMHVWALAGLNPIGTIAFGYLADATTLQVALIAGGWITLAVAIYAWVKPGGLKAVD